MIEYVKIPKQRKAALIGKNGSVKKEIEKISGVKLDIAPDSSDVKIDGNEPDRFIRVRDVVTAIGRGFDPRTAMKLLGDDCHFEKISLKNETENTIKRLMARIIGRKGSIKRKIQKITGSKICVYGKTVSFIGGRDENLAARKLVEEILEGKPLAKIFARS